MGKKEIFQSAKEAVAEWKEREGEMATLASFLSMLQVVVVVFSFHDSGSPTVTRSDFILNL